MRAHGNNLALHRRPPNKSPVGAGRSLSLPARSSVGA
jgi:hypothetical protein